MAWPTRGQQAPDFWDTGLREYIDAAPADQLAIADSVFTQGLNSRYLQINEAAPSLVRYRQAGDTDWAAAFGRAFTAAPRFLTIPPSATPYDVASGVTIPINMTLQMYGATLRATSAISGAVLSTEKRATGGQWWRDQMIIGGVVDCNGLAATGIDIPYALNSGIADTTVRESTSHAVLIGDTTAPGATNEVKLRSLKVDRSTSGAVPAGSFGIWVRNASDSTFIDCRVVGSATSFRNDKTANKFIACHGWGWAGRLPTTIFDDVVGSGNSYIGCEADTPSAYGFRFRGFNATVIGGFAYNNTAGTDNIAEAVHYDNAVPFSAVHELTITGQDASHRWAKDVGGITFPNAGFTGHTLNTNVVSQNTNIARTNVFATNSWIQPSGGAHIYSGSADPNGSVNANTIGDIYFRSGGGVGAGATLYKATNTSGAWTAIA